MLLIAGSEAEQVDGGKWRCLVHVLDTKSVKLGYVEPLDPAEETTFGLKAVEGNWLVPEGAPLRDSEVEAQQDCQDVSVDEDDRIYYHGKA